MSKIKQLADWFDDRTGYRDIVAEALYENIPGGSRWRYVWGSTLVFAFTVQVITGSFLWMAYSPSSQTAWESVFYVQHVMQGGSWLRGIHHFTAQAMVVLLALHLWQVVIDGAYKAPREVNFWLGLILLQVVLGLSLTGYLLPWDQKGYWATRVATNIMSTIPLVGDRVQQVVVGGAEYGHHTLTRFFALHAGVLPGLLVLFLALHIYVFRRHGLHCKRPVVKPDGTFWPDQVLKDGVACLAVLGVVLFLVKFLGAELGAPAEPSSPYSAARPEWYFLFLFQFLKYFPGELEVLGAVVIPGAVMGLLFLMPIIGKWNLGHRFNVVLLFALLIGAGGLTAVAVRTDRGDRNYANAVWEARQHAALAESLAHKGIPAEGAAKMMRDDLQVRALQAISRQCLGCHAYTDDNDSGARPEKPSAPNLYAFARPDRHRQWLTGLLDPERVDTTHYFGNTEMKQGDMVNFVKNDLKKMKPADVTKIVEALAAEADEPEGKPSESVVEGRKLISDADNGCAQCHEFRGAGELGTAPSLTGYASRKWIIGMIENANAEPFYGHLGEKQKMPVFGNADNPDRKPPLDPAIIGQIADWLRGAWQEPLGLAPRKVSTADESQE